MSISTLRAMARMDLATSSHISRLDADADAAEETSLSLLSAAIYAIVGVQLPFFPIWLYSRGLGDAEIALILAAPPAIKIVSTLIASRFGDRSGKHGALLVGAAAVVVCAFVCMGFLQGFAPIFAAVALLAVAQGPIGILADGIILGAAQRRSAQGRPQLHYSRVRGWGSLSILAFMLASGPVARMLPNDAISWLLAGVAFASALVAFGSLRSVEEMAPASASAGRATPLERPLLILGVIVAATLIQSSHALALSFASLHWKASGHDETFVSLAWSAALVTEVAFFLMAGRWFGGENKAASHLILGGAAAVVRWALMATDPGEAGVIAAQALHGLSCAAVQLGPAYLLAQLAGPSRLAQAQGWLAASNGAALCLATLACGAIYGRFGESGYVLMAVMAAFGFALALVVADRLRRRGAPRGLRLPNEIVAQAGADR